MNTVRRGKRQVKGEEPKRITLADFALHAPVDTLVESLQALIPLGLMAVGDCLKADVARLAGARCRRGDGLAGHVRWGRQRGSVYLADQKLPIQVPRVRNRLTGQEAPLETYTRLQRPRGAETLPSTNWIASRRSAKAIRLSSIAIRSAVQPRREGEVRVNGRLSLGLDYEATAEYP